MTQYRQVVLRAKVNRSDLTQLTQSSHIKVHTHHREQLTITQMSNQMPKEIKV